MSVSEKKPINRQFERVSAEDVRRAAEYQAAILADVAGRRGTLHGRIKPLAPHMSVAGPEVLWRQACRLCGLMNNSRRINS